MPKYWGKQIFTHGRFPEVGQKEKTEKKKERKRREKLNDGNNNGQLRIATPPLVAHAKPPGPKLQFINGRDPLVLIVVCVYIII